jgi:hypothetical protein
MSSDSNPTFQEDLTYVLELELAEQEGLFGSTSLSDNSSLITQESDTLLQDVRFLFDLPDTSNTMATELELNGVKYERHAAKKPLNETAEQVFHKKQDRAGLTTKDQTALFNEAVKQAHKKYDYVLMALNDENKLDNTYNLDVLITKTYRSHCAFDLHDVFSIIIPKEDDESAVDCVLDLYTEYSSISIEDVARSNLFYQEWMVADWFSENLGLTYDFFQNNVTDDLFLKVSKTYDKFPRSQRGGPLFFILMLNQLLADTEEAAISLQKRVKDFKITNIPGEDVRKVVSLLCGAVNRLTYINKIPEDLVKTLLGVMQTSSVDSFNETFHLIEKERKHHAILRKTGFHATLTADNIFSIAEAKYRDLGENSQWTGVHTTGQAAAFNAAHRSTRTWTPTCFNCGGPHSNKECPKPADPKRIAAAVKKF